MTGESDLRGNAFWLVDKVCPAHASEEVEDLKRVINKLDLARALADERAEVAVAEIEALRADIAGARADRDRSCAVTSTVGDENKRLWKQLETLQKTIAEERRQMFDARARANSLQREYDRRSQLHRDIEGKLAAADERIAELLSQKVRIVVGRPGEEDEIANIPTGSVILTREDGFRVIFP
jgi:chromosome segregation ATPase